MLLLPLAGSGQTTRETGNESADYPQNPKPPYPYECREAAYASCDSIRIAGTVTIPRGEGPFPAAVIISGTGMQDRNGTFAGHKPFHRIADSLTRAGFVVLRSDDRGMGGSTGTYEFATTRDFACDVQAGIDFLKSLPEVDTSRIGVIGHSEGGAVAFMLGAESPDVAFVVSLAGVGVDGLKILKLQNRAILETTPGVTAAQVEAYMSLFNALFETVRATPTEQSVDAPLRETFTQWRERQDSATLASLNMVNGRDEMFIARYVWNAGKRWYREMIAYDPADYIPHIRVPVLAMNGDRDIMVPARENLASIRSLLERGSNTRHEVVTLPGLNHMFQRCVTGTQSEMRTLSDVFAPEAMRLLTAWLQENVR